MIRRPPRSTLDRSSAASDVYKRQARGALHGLQDLVEVEPFDGDLLLGGDVGADRNQEVLAVDLDAVAGIVAVSYTHLRAHETVLDIVCRLLLEKKKTEHA